MITTLRFGRRLLMAASAIEADTGRLDRRAPRLDRLLGALPRTTRDWSEWLVRARGALVLGEDVPPVRRATLGLLGRWRDRRNRSRSTATVERGRDPGA